MSIERLTRVFELERLILGAGTLMCPILAIEEAEKSLGTVFPPTYRYYLKHFHLNTRTEIFGVEITKEGNLNKMSSVFRTFKLRDEQKLPEQFILIDQDYIWQHVIDSTRVDEAGDSPVLHWSEGEERVVYPDFDGFYLEMVNNAIYSYLMDKADDRNQILTKQEVENYINLHLKLGFTENEDKFLKQNWAELRSTGR